MLLLLLFFFFRKCVRNNNLFCACHFDAASTRLSVIFFSRISLSRSCALRTIVLVHCWLYGWFVSCLNEQNGHKSMAFNLNLRWHEAFDNYLVKLWTIVSSYDSIFTWLFFNYSIWIYDKMLMNIKHKKNIINQMYWSKMRLDSVNACGKKTEYHLFRWCN